MLTAAKITYNNVQIDIGTSEDYVNSNTLKPVTKIFYVVTVDNKIYYATDLPNIDTNAVCLSYRFISMNPQLI